MNILELDSYNLADAVKFNDQLNPKLWGPNEHLKPEVRDRLLEIADDFSEFLGVTDLDLQDITISGSNAAYTYTPNSDIDLHLVVKLPNNEVYRELFDAKKFQYNEQHNITIGGYNVELYVQDADQPHISQGIYSVINDEWIQVPRRVKSVVDDTSTENKFKTVGLQIERAIKSGSLKRMTHMAEKIKKMRQTGLESHGEFGPENLAFKMLRSQGKIKQLYDARNAAKDQELSLDERRKAKKKKRVKYGFGGYWYPGTGYAGQDTPAAQDSGGDGGGGESIKEDATISDEDILKDFVKFCVAELKIESMPTVKLRRDPQWSVVNRTFGRYINDAHLLEVAWGQRHIMDVLRTVAHELTHKHQHEREGHRMGPDAGETGSPYENEANARAGVLMRDYGRLHPEYFAVGQAHDLQAGPLKETAPVDPDTAWKQQVRQLTQTYQANPFILSQLAQEKGAGSAEAAAYEHILNPQGRIPLPPGANVKESASGYIPTKKQAKDPRYSMALTVDIKPGQVGKEANKLKLKTDRQGHPQIARANGLFENLFKEYKQYKADEDYSPDEPPGPESKPTMPKGTVRVDVSDVYDWYKLGQHISNMKGLGKHDFGKGPPSAIISFGDEDTEHEFIGDLEATGLDVTDIDPADPKQPPGKTIKIDPTYNVDEVIQTPVAKGKDAEQYYKFIVGKARLGRPLTRAEQDYVKMYQMYRQQKLAEDEDLDEVKMSPGALEKFATSDSAKGIRAGFEAELIFRDTQGESEELDPEPNYDADERAYSIQQVIDFFSNDEYGYGLSDREQMRLTDNLDEAYMEWRDSQITDDFRNDAEDLIREVLLEETPMSERINVYLTDSMQKSDEEADRIIAAGADAPRFNTSKDQEAYAAENPDYATYLEAADAAEAELDESVEYSVKEQDGYWDEALDDYRDNYSGDDDSFFSDVGLRWMSDVANEFGLDWPVWDGGEQQNQGSRSWEDIGSELQAVVDMPVVVSTDYHSTRRRPGQWIIEPDGSLHPDDRSEEAGLEIVSPPMPLLTAIEKLRQVTDWANDPSGGNAYTNSSTGLHMGVSLPKFTSEDADSDAGIDYVKLILFMGDKYVQQQFGREANNFCASALGKLQQNIKGKRSDPAGVIELLRHGLTELAYRELQKGVGSSKYTSAHIQDGYIEFRSPGGDWLAKGDEEIGILENTMLRFARAMAIAGDPSAERQEYAKKLYKLVTEGNEQYADQLKLFSEFSAGTIDKEQLKKQWAEKTLDKDQPGRREKGEWTVIDLNTRRPILQPLYDETRAEAWERAKESGKLAPGGRYDVVPYNSGRWEIYSYDVDDDSKEQRLEIVDADNVNKAADLVYDKYNADNIPFKVRPYYGDVAATPAPKLTPRAKLAKRIVEPKAQPQAKEQQARNERGVPYWEIYEKETGHVVHTMLSDDSADAATDAYNWLTSIGAEQPNLFAVRAKMIPNPQATDAKKDSVDLQRRLGVQDVDTDVAQNFEPRRQNYELVSDEDPDRVLHRMSNATADEVRAWIAQQEAGGMPAGFLRTRIVAESLRSSIAQAIVGVEENFADGKVKGKSRPGRVKRAGASCNGSVTDLRARAKRASGEKAKMYHWCANMKSGKKK